MEVLDEIVEIFSNLQKIYLEDIKCPPLSLTFVEVILEIADFLTERQEIWEKEKNNEILNDISFKKIFLKLSPTINYIEINLTKKFSNLPLRVSFDICQTLTIQRMIGLFLCTFIN